MNVEQVGTVRFLGVQISQVTVWQLGVQSKTKTKEFELNHVEEFWG